MPERYRAFFQRFLGDLDDPNSNDDVTVLCIFHDDHNPSLVVNLETGQYNCFVCHNRGDSINFLIETLDIDFKTAKKIVQQYETDPDLRPEVFHIPGIIPEATIQGWHEALLTAKSLMQWLLEKKGINSDTVTNNRLGWDGTRITIPIRNKFGQVVNVRRYDRNAQGNDKFMNYATGWGTARLFPADMLQQAQLLICEGEWDALLAGQLGLPAITNTGGAGTWKKEWNDRFEGKTVVICYDVDQAGRDGSRKVAEALWGVAKTIFVLQLPLSEPPGADISNYFLDGGQTREDLLELIKRTSPYAPPKPKTGPTPLPPAGSVQQVPLEQAREARYIHKPVQFDALCMGKDTSPYIVPKTVEWKCEVYGSRKICGGCSLGGNGQLTQSVGSTVNILDLIRVAKTQKQGTLSSWAGVAKCPMPTFEETETQIVEEVLFTEHIDAMSFEKEEESRHIVQNAFNIADKEAIHTNRSYRVAAVGVPDPWQQKITFIVQGVEPLQDTVESFKLPEGGFERLSQHFSVPEDTVEALDARFQAINDDHSHNVSHIFGRSDLHTFIDLVYHSVRGFYFERELIPRGWLDALVIGDTRTGKSETATELVHHYGVGEMVLAEQASIAGLIGGLQQVGDKRFYLTWGKIPMNDSRLVVLDEVSGLEVEDIAQFSGIRSSGVAELTKIVSEKTYSRTRLLWLSNPRTGAALRTYSPGVKAVVELIGKSEDVARFDIAMAAATDEVDPSEIHTQRAREDIPKHVYTSDVCKELVLWVWSRKPTQIHFLPETIATIYKHALILGRSYSSEIPLVESASIHVKIARIAAAVAGRTFSTEDGENLIVKPVHVEFAVKFINYVYSKQSFDYRGFSQAKISAEQKALEHTEEVLEYVAAFPEVTDLIRHNDIIQAADLEEQLAIDRPVVKDHLAFFSRTRMIARGTGGYRKTPVFIQLLRGLDGVSRNGKDPHV